MRRAIAGRLERLHPILWVPEVSAGAGAAADRQDPEVAAHWRAEAYYERFSTEAQRLSMQLSLLYHRDVFCENGMWAGTWVELTAAGTWKFRFDGNAPSRRFLFHGNYRSLKVAPDLARMLLRRDVGQPVPEPLADAPPPVPEPFADAPPPAPVVQALNWPGFAEHDPIEFDPLDIPLLTE